MKRRVKAKRERRIVGVDEIIRLGGNQIYV